MSYFKNLFILNEKMLHLIYRYLFCLLCFLLPMEGAIRALPNIIFACLGFLFLFKIKKEDLILKFRNHSVLLYCVLIFYIVIGLVLSNRISENLNFLSKFFLVLGLILISTPLKNEINKSKIFMILGVLSSIIISIFSVALYKINQGEFLFSVGGHINKVLLTERVYIAFFCVISFIFSLDLLKNKEAKQFYKVFLLVNIALVIGFVLLIAARMALISIITVSFYQMLFFKKKLFYGTFLIGIVVIVSAFFLNKNLMNRFFYKNQNKSLIENVETWEPRVAIWRCSYHIFKQESFNKITGFTSFSMTESELLNCYDTTIENISKRRWFIKKEFNSHNQYIDFTLSFGLIAFLLFITIFGYSLFTERKNRTVVSLIISFFLLGMVENYFHRQMGSYLFGVFLIFMFSKINLRN